MTTQFKCWRCGHGLVALPKNLPRLEQCPACEADLHVCRFCRSYKPSLIRKCDHDLAEPAREVDIANFCQYFRASSQAYVAKEADKARQAQEKLAALFGEPAETEHKTPSDDPMEKLKSLFKDIQRD
ncbi:MAG: hypothetical protein R6X06_07375 [Gammaproteobacteria bacterium]